MNVFKDLFDVTSPNLHDFSERLVHRTVDTTMRHYAHVLNELRQKDTLNTVATFTEMKKAKIKNHQ